MLAAYLAGGSATDGCSATQRLAPQANGSDVTSATFFRGGTTAVTFRYRDGAGNIGTATSDVTVRLYGDLDVNANVDSADLVIMANYLVGNVTPGTPPFTAFRSAADLDRDSLVDAVDYVIHANYLVDNITCLPTR
jgi:hypothetical protein